MQMGDIHTSNGGSHELVVSLTPVLCEQTGGRLGKVEWFRSRWQRGGAATGFSTYRTDDSGTIDVFVKLPVNPVEYRWTTELGGTRAWTPGEACAQPTPRVVAHGLEIGGYDLAWLITERLSGQPLAASQDENDVCDLLRVAADFQAAAIKVAPLKERPAAPEWEPLLQKAKEVASAPHFAEHTRWKEAVKRTIKCLPVLKARWASRPINAWCHGDLHAGNALRRVCGACVLVDLALVHPGHWLEDALYLERQHWGRAELLHGVKPVSELARHRRARNLPVDDHYPDIANVRRVLMAACAPAMIEREGNPKYLHGALEILERTLPQAAK
jgi:hypothetical protein